MLSVKKIKKFSECAKIWLKEQRYAVKESTYAHYYDLIQNHINPYLGEMTIGKITKEDLIQFNNYLLEEGNLRTKKGLSPKTVNDIDIILKQILLFFGYDVKLKNPKVSKNKIQILEKYEQARLENYIMMNLNSYYLGIMICLYTGLRIGEVCALRWKDIDLKKRLIYINNTLIRITDVDNKNTSKLILGQPKTESSIRSIPINNKLYNLLAYSRSSKTERYVLTSKSKYIEPRNYYDRYKTLMKEVGLDHYNFHVLRHTFATRCIEVGIDAKSLSEILGHASIKTTMMLYVHPTMESKKIYLDKISDYRKK